jgi:hypothetical protein
MKKLLLLLFALLFSLTLFSQPYVTRLTNTSCNSTLVHLYSTFVAYKKPCDGYLFIITNTSTGLTDTTVTYGRVAGRVSNLSNFLSIGVTYGTVYIVDVRSWIGTPNNHSVASAVPCTITTPCGTTLSSSSAGQVINYLYYDDIICNLSSCPWIEDYQFRYRIPTSPNNYVVATQGTETVENGTDNKVRLYEFGPISNFPSSNPYGKTYRISVRLKLNGTWTPFGNERIVWTPPNPTVTLRDGTFPAAGASQCGNIVSPYAMVSINEILAAYNLYGFTYYEYEVTNMTTMVTEILHREASQFGSMARAFRLTMVGDPTPNGLNGIFVNDYNTVFRIRVRTDLGSWGSECYVKTPVTAIPVQDPNLTERRPVKYINTIGQEIDPMNTKGLIITVYSDGSITKTIK